MLINCDIKGEMNGIPYLWEAKHDEKYMVFSIIYKGEKICREVGNVYGANVTDEIFELMTSMEMELAIEQHENDCELERLVNEMLCKQ